MRRARGRSPRMGAQMRRSMGAVHVTLGPKGRNVLSGATIGDDTTLTETPPDFTAMFTQIVKQQEKIQAQLDEDAKNRRIALVIAGASALFAAVKLGIIAFPHLRSRVSRSPA